MITLYQSEWCFYSHRVRQVLTELGLTYTTVNVPAAREDRAELMAIAGQDTAPVLIDGDKVFGDSDEIIEYLRATYPAPEDADEHAAMGAWRAAMMVSLAPRAALARLRELLEQKGFVVLAQIKGPKINERLPAEYVHPAGDRAGGRGQVARRRPAGAGCHHVPDRRRSRRRTARAWSRPPTPSGRYGSTANWSSGTCRRP